MIPELERSPGGGNGNPPQYFCLKNSMDRRAWQATAYVTTKSWTQLSLVGCSPWGPEESDITERLHFHVSLSGIGEGNGNPLWCSCLENPRDGGAWWAAVYGVAAAAAKCLTNLA